MAEIQNQKADGNISDIDDFFELVYFMWNKIYEGECEFVEEQPLQTTPERLTIPKITYELYHRSHTKEMPQGKKPKIWSSKPDPANPDYSITEVSEFFDCNVRFRIYGNTKKQSKEWAKKFEMFMLTYTGLFKQKGTQDIMFLEETEHKVSTTGQQELPHRTLLYLVRIQRMQIIRSIRFKEIEATLGVYNQTKEGLENYPSSLKDSEFLRTYNKYVK